MPVKENLWPDITNEVRISEPAQILREQAEALREKTDGVLYAQVEESALPSGDGVVYDFYVHVSGKPYHYLLLSVQHGFHTDYPARISNTLAGTITQVEQKQFKNNIRMIFGSPATQELLQRMLAFAKNKEPDSQTTG